MWRGGLGGCCCVGSMVCISDGTDALVLYLHSVERIRIGGRSI